MKKLIALGLVLFSYSCFADWLPFAGRVQFKFDDSGSDSDVRTGRLLYNESTLKVRGVEEISNNTNSNNYFDTYPLSGCNKIPSEYSFNTFSSLDYVTIYPQGDIYNYIHIYSPVTEVYEKSCGNVVEMCLPDYDSGFPGGICDVIAKDIFW